MPRIYTSIEIDRPIEQVFDYVTTPANWPDWHTTALDVSGTTERSLEAGEAVTEDVKLMGRRSSATWTVRERTPPTRWVIEGQIAAGAKAVITYHLRANGAGTTFGREVVYTLPRALALVNGVLVKPRLEAEATASLRRLKDGLEGKPA
jgi:uncharacterized protein YndB with AHSA1/START domain